MTTTTTRPIEFTHSAFTGHAIHRVLATEELRHRLSPFVFLDHFDVSVDHQWGFDWHPHSGVATVTYVLSSDLDHADTSGAGGRVPEGSVQWMAAGNGIWHKEYYRPGADHRVSGLQMWIALPPDLENGPIDYQHAEATALPVEGTTQVLVGHYGGTSSPIKAPVEFNYFNVALREDQHWRYQPPANHDVAWLYMLNGSAIASGTEVPEKTLAVFVAGEEPLDVAAIDDDAQFVVGTAPKNHNPIVAQGGSMHTSSDAMRSGQQRIAKIRKELLGRNAGGSSRTG